MNQWECQHAGCKNACVGVGGAIGLRAIGWYFEPGPIILCPVHHPQSSVSVKYLGCELDSCNLCFASLQADILQAVIAPIKVRDSA